MTLKGLRQSLGCLLLWVLAPSHCRPTSAGMPSLISAPDTILLRRGLLSRKTSRCLPTCRRLRSALRGVHAVRPLPPRGAVETEAEVAVVALAGVRTADEASDSALLLLLGEGVATFEDRRGLIGGIMVAVAVAAAAAARAVVGVVVVDGAGDGTTAPLFFFTTFGGRGSHGEDGGGASGGLVFVAAAPARVLAAGPPAARSEGMYSVNMFSRSYSDRKLSSTRNGSFRFIERDRPKWVGGLRA